MIEEYIKSEFDLGLKSGKYTIGFYYNIFEYDSYEYKYTDNIRKISIIEVIYSDNGEKFSKSFGICIKCYLRLKKLRKI